jgi:hypothetical protein
MAERPRGSKPTKQIGADAFRLAADCERERVLDKYLGERRRLADPERRRALDRYLGRHYPELDRTTALARFIADRSARVEWSRRYWGTVKDYLRRSYPDLHPDDALNKFRDGYDCGCEDLAALRALVVQLNRAALGPTAPGAPTDRPTPASSRRSHSTLALPSDLANKYGIPGGVLADAQRKLAQRSPDCREEVANWKPREPRYIYRRDIVRPLCERLQRRAGGRPFGQAHGRAKKNLPHISVETWKISPSRLARRTPLDNTP